MLGVAVAAFVLSVAPADAYPVGTTCGASATNADGISKADVTFRSSNADDCFGLHDGNINGASDLNTAVASWGGAFILADATGGSSTLADGINWTLTAVTGTPNTWKLEYSADPDVTKSYDLALAIKAGNAWSAWLFDDESFSTDGEGDGTWLIHWEASGGGVPCAPTGPCTPPNLSHMIAFIQPSGTTGSEELTGSNEQTTGNEQVTGSNEQTTGNEQVTGSNEITVPGPAPLALIGIGLIGLAIGGRRRRR